MTPFLRGPLFTLGLPFISSLLVATFVIGSTSVLAKPGNQRKATSQLSVEEALEVHQYHHICVKKWELELEQKTA